MWFLVALCACCFNVARDYLIKKHYRGNADTLVFTTRVISFFLLLILLPFFPFEVPRENLGRFALCLLFTVVLTMAATILKLKVIQREEFSKTMPLLSLVPLFVLPWSIVLLRELPTPLALVGVLVAAAGSVVLLSDDLRGVFRSKNVLFALIVVAVFGLTTVLDKLAVGFTNAYTYTLIFCFCSMLSGLYVLRTRGIPEVRGVLCSGFNFLQSFCWIAYYFGQQIAIQLSYSIPSNTAYIKSVMYFGTIVSVILGGKLLKERHFVRRLLGALVIIAGNVLILLSI